MCHGKKFSYRSPIVNLLTVRYKMAEFAGKGVAGSALGLAIGGLSLAALQGGLLPGLTGGNVNNAEMEALRAENTLLKGNQYTNEQMKDVIVAQAVQGQKLADMEKQMELKEEITAQRIAAVATAANNGIAALGAALTGLQNTVNGITATYIPAAKMTPNPVADYSALQALASAMAAFSKAAPSGTASAASTSAAGGD